MQLWGDGMKVGDKVRVKFVRPGRYITEEFPKTGIYFMDEMQRYCGKVIKVEELCAILQEKQKTVETFREQYN